MIGKWAKLIRISALAVLGLFGHSYANAFCELGGVISYRSFSTQADNGGSFFYPEAGGRVTCFNDSMFSPEIRYGFTKAQDSSIKITEHAAHFGVRMNPIKSNTWIPHFLTGISYFFTKYEGALDDYSQIAFYAGIGVSYQIEVFFVRVDANQHIWMNDTAISINLSTGLSF